MNETRSFASLTGSLLARKGGARPAMRPRPLTHDAMLDDLGWNDMGDSAADEPVEHVPSSIAALTPAPKLVMAREEEPQAEHVPSSIAALTPAPKPIAPREEVPQAEHVPSPIAALTPAPKPAAPREEAPQVHAQQRALAEQFGQNDEGKSDELILNEPILNEAVVAALRAPAPKRSEKKSKAAAEGKKVAFTLRLDGDRHLRLRLASAVTGKSSQQLVTSALDAMLHSLPELRSLAEKLPARAAAKN